MPIAVLKWPKKQQAKRQHLKITRNFGLWNWRKPSYRRRAVLSLPTNQLLLVPAFLLSFSRLSDQLNLSRNYPLLITTQQWSSNFGWLAIVPGLPLARCLMDLQSILIFFWTLYRSHLQLLGRILHMFQSSKTSFIKRWANTYIWSTNDVTFFYYRSTIIYRRTAHLLHKRWF